MTWFEGMGYCRSLNSEAYLAEDIDFVTHTFITDLAETQVEQRWWLGGSNFEVKFISKMLHFQRFAAKVYSK